MREDAKQFIERARSCGLFGPGEIVVARAPGRLDLMGGIADYSGSLVLQMPIAEATFAAAQRSDEPVVRVVSGARRYELPVEQLAGPLAPYEQARSHFAATSADHWAAYVIGVLVVLGREKELRVPHGLRLFIDSRVPEGKGVSSSAAVEVATMQAVSHLLGVTLAPEELATLCQKVENLVAGAPCGIMDQMASACGREGKLLALLCQPAQIQGHVDLPGEIGVWGIDSGIRHAVTGSDYGSVRVGAFMGYRIIADQAGLPAKVCDGRVAIKDTRWGGYLANITPSEFDGGYRAFLPDTMSGERFLARYGAISDSVTRVDPTKVYPVQAPTAHPIGEHFRIRMFAHVLRGRIDDTVLRLLGEMMYQSHVSYTSCLLGSEGTDRLVELVREAGPAQGLYGAKITGGGSGGTVAVLGHTDAGEAVRRVAQRYAEETGREPYIFQGSSPGAAEFGVLRI